MNYIVNIFTLVEILFMNLFFLYNSHSFNFYKNYNRSLARFFNNKLIFVILEIIYGFYQDNIK